MHAIVGVGRHVYAAFGRDPNERDLVFAREGAFLRRDEPILECQELLDRVGRADAPRGRLLITAAVNGDGSVAETDAEPDDLPQELADCTVRVLRKMRFGPVQNDLASIEIDLRFVYRALPFRPRPAVPPAR